MDKPEGMTMGAFRRMTKDIPDEVPLHIDCITKGVASLPANKVIICSGANPPEQSELRYTHVDVCRFVEGERE